MWGPIFNLLHNNFTNVENIWLIQSNILWNNIQRNIIACSTISMCSYDNWTKLCATFYAPLFQCMDHSDDTYTHTIFIYSTWRFLVYFVEFASSTSRITNDWAMCYSDKRQRLVHQSTPHRFQPEELSPTVPIYNCSILYAIKLRRAKVNKTVGSRLFSFFLFHMCLLPFRPKLSLSLKCWILFRQKLISIAPLQMDNQIKSRHLR